MTIVNHEVIIKLVKDYFENEAKRHLLVDPFRGVEGVNNSFFFDAFVACGGKLVKDGKFQAPQFKKKLRILLIGKVRTQVANELGPIFREFLESTKKLTKLKSKENVIEESSVIEVMSKFPLEENLNSEMGFEAVTEVTSEILVEENLNSEMGFEAVTEVTSEILVEESSISKMGFEPRNFQLDYKIDQVDIDLDQEELFEQADVEMVDDSTALHKMDTEVCDLNMRQFVCTEFDCKKSFRSNGQLTSHKKKVHGEKKFSCLICEKKFTTIFGLTQHQKSHKPKVSLAKPKVMTALHCSICFFLCKSKVTLKQHMKIHNPDKEMHDCSQCDKSYPRKNALVEHIRMIHDKIRFSCEICKNGFLQKKQLTRHQKTHLEGGKFSNPCLCGEYIQRGSNKNTISCSSCKITYHCECVKAIYDARKLWLCHLCPVTGDTSDEVLSNLEEKVIDHALADFIKILKKYLEEYFKDKENEIITLRKLIYMFETHNYTKQKAYDDMSEITVLSKKNYSFFKILADQREMLFGPITMKIGNSTIDYSDGPLVLPSELLKVSEFTVTNPLKLLGIEKKCFLKDNYKKFDKETIVLAAKGQVTDRYCEIINMITQKYPGIQIFAAGDLDLGGIYFGQNFLKKFPSAIYIGMFPDDRCDSLDPIDISEYDESNLLVVRGSPFEHIAKHILKTGKKEVMDNSPNLAEKLTGRMNAELFKNPQQSESNEIQNPPIQEEIIAIDENQPIPNIRLMNVFGRDIYQNAMDSLRPGLELDDAIVDVSMMFARAENEAEERFELLSAIDFSAHYNSGGARLANEAVNYRNIIDRSTVLLPISIGRHWQLVVINGTDVQIYDSAASPDREAFTITAVRSFLNAIEQRDWIFNFPECDQQADYQDQNACGMFVYMFADKVCGNKEVTDKSLLSRERLAGKFTHQP